MGDAVERASKTKKAFGSTELVTGVRTNKCIAYTANVINRNVVGKGSLSVVQSYAHCSEGRENRVVLLYIQQTIAADVGK